MRRAPNWVQVSIAPDRQLSCIRTHQERISVTSLGAFLRFARRGLGKNVSRLASSEYLACH